MNEFSKIKTLTVGEIPFDLKFSRTFLALACLCSECYIWIKYPNEPQTASFGAQKYTYCEPCAIPPRPSSPRRRNRSRTLRRMRGSRLAEGAKAVPTTPSRRRGQSVSQSVISRSRPALTPPPARSPAPLLSTCPLVPRLDGQELRSLRGCCSCVKKF